MTKLKLHLLKAGLVALFIATDNFAETKFKSKPGVYKTVSKISMSSPEVSFMCKLKRNGPRIDPWGTHEVHDLNGEVLSFILTHL